MSAASSPAASSDLLAMQLLAQNPSPILHLTATGDVQYANPAAEALLQQFSPTERPMQLQRLAALTSPVGQPLPEIVLAGQYFSVAMVPAAHGAGTLYLTDATASYLKDQRAFFETVFHHLPTGVAIFDAQHRFQYVNPAAIRNAEIREWIIGKNNFEYCLHRNHPLDMAVERKRQFERAVQQRAEVTWEETIQSPTGPRHWLRLYHPVFGPDGELRMLVGSSADITDRYLAEQELERAKQVAEASVRARETFLSNMSHEIRTPMNGVLGMAGLLARTELSAQQQEYVSIIRNSGNHLLSVLNDVLDVAKITSGKLEMEHTPFDLANVIRIATQTQAFRATEKGIRFLLHPLQLPAQPVLGDPHRLSQVLLNLLSNAIKFTQQGEVALLVRCQAETESALTVQFQVSDTGVGVPAHKQEAIFDSFSQAYADTTRNFGGTGLGLTISSSLVEQLGGNLVVCSVPGEGSTFSFSLTFAKAAATQAVPDAHSLAATDAELVRGWRVLLVEDHDINRLLAQLVLEHYGVLVDAAISGAAALQLFEQHRYECILMDIQMPDMSGLDVTAAMRRHTEAARATTPIIAFTANAFRADNEKYLAAGMDDCMTKPFDEAELLRKMLALHRPSNAAAPLFDLSDLHQMAHGNPAFVRRILEAFMQQTPTLLAQLEQAVAAAAWPAAAACAHKLKPSLKLLRCLKLLEATQLLETKPATEAHKSAAQHLISTLPRLLTQLQKHLATDAMPN
ncbi:PAS domain-containing hybrid sensor histidine kinase/response regulator [Hymenobacter sediminicola]|uniref:histidine kinase n=1 Tax=Hymenobacter sediminicola TaxID=2761579 RepID=A0A7G7WA14_9BACT|nr:PAS domain-containing sensor histidine kinase [Hymenobacter sediminicola]QNH63207.1 response regulator [Hymenobacter sediminicola]